MAEAVRVIGSMHGSDALEFALHEETRPLEQDPAVVAQCPRVLQSIVDLCARFEPTDIILPRHARSLGPETEPYMTATPPVRYQSEQTGAVGFIQLVTLRWPPFKKRTENSYRSSLWMSVPSERAIPSEREIYSISAKKFITLSGSESLYSGDQRYAAGTRTELNQFGILVDKIRAALFPKQS